MRVSLRAFLLLLLALAFPAPGYGQALVTGSDFQRQVEKKTFELINAYRDREGLTPLKWNEGIAQIARVHSRDMASGDANFGHGGFGDRVDQMKGLIAGFQGAGENVLYTTELDDVAERAVQMWLHSPHHLRNIRGDYTFSGIGVSLSPGGALYFTQLFLKTAEPGN
jgi:uncharacterized protein YkwD